LRRRANGKLNRVHCLSGVVRSSSH